MFGVDETAATLPRRVIVRVCFLAVPSKGPQRKFDARSAMALQAVLVWISRTTAIGISARSSQGRPLDAILSCTVNLDQIFAVLADRARPLDFKFGFYT